MPVPSNGEARPCSTVEPVSATYQGRAVRHGRFKAFGKGRVGDSSGTLMAPNIRMIASPPPNHFKGHDRAAATMEPDTNVLFTFGDSSGNPSRSAKSIADTPHYITATLTMGAKEAYRIDARLQELKIKHFGTDGMEQVPFHACALRNRLFWKTRNLALVDESFAAIFDDIVDIVLNMDAIIDVVIMDKRPANSTFRSTNTTVKSWNRAFDILYQTLLRSPDTAHVILLDRYDDVTNRIVGKIFAQAPGPFVGIDTLRTTTMPGPMFVTSRSCNLIQLADMIAYIVAKVNKTNDAGFFARWYALIEPKISRVLYDSVD